MLDPNVKAEGEVNSTDAPANNEAAQESAGQDQATGADQEEGTTEG